MASYTPHVTRLTVSFAPTGPGEAMEHFAIPAGNDRRLVMTLTGLGD